MELKIMLQKDAILPKYATAGSVGFDFYASEATTIEARGYGMVHTGVAFEIPEGYEIQLRPRSSLALKHGITILNSPATIDTDYRGEIKIVLINHSDTSFEVNVGDRIAQGVLASYARAQMVCVTELTSTERGDKGYGSSGISKNLYEK